MKLQTFVSVFVLLCLFLLPPAFAGGDTIGSLPAVSAEADHGKDVKPNESHTNGDGVTVDNNKDSKGNIKITPKTGNDKSETKVTYKNGAVGTTTGLDSNDTCSVGANCTATISADGSYISIAGGSTATVTNTGSAPLAVHTPAGGQTIIPPGGSATIIT